MHAQVPDDDDATESRDNSVVISASGADEENDGQGEDAGEEAGQQPGEEGGE